MKAPSGERGIFVDLSARAKFVVRGTDRIRFLNGQLTNDVRKAGPQTAIEACILNAKGRIDAHVFVSSTDEECFLDAEPELRESLSLRLERYIIADDVSIEDVTETFALQHVIDGEKSTLPNEWRLVRAHRLATPGWDIWMPTSDRERAKETLATSFAEIGVDELETLRIECGLPRWGRELTNEINPIEAGLETRCIDYAKGCYLGQEVISRMKMSGQTNKKLCGLRSADVETLTPGARLFSSVDEKDVGWVTSATRSAKLGHPIALGFVKRGFNAPGTQLQFAKSNVRVDVEVVELPWTDSLGGNES